MQAHFKLDDDSFEQQFDSAVLPDALFTHEAHLRLAWIQLERFDIEEAASRLCRQIQKYASSLGEATKFHRTLSIAAVHVVAHFKQKSKAVSFQEVLQEFPQLNCGFKELLLSHYSADVLFSTQAKKPLSGT